MMLQYLFYIGKQREADNLVQQQIKDKWTQNQIETYWLYLGYDCFFVVDLMQRNPIYTVT